MHYIDCSTTEEKIIHVLYAADFEGMIDVAIDECIKEFGKEITDITVDLYENEYKHLG